MGGVLLIRGILLVSYHLLIVSSRSYTSGLKTNKTNYVSRQLLGIRLDRWMVISPQNDQPLVLAQIGQFSSSTASATQRFVASCHGS